MSQSILYITYYRKGYRANQTGIPIENIEDIQTDQHTQKVFDESWKGWTDGWNAAAENKQLELL
jgi:hypothetical protein